MSQYEKNCCDNDYMFTAVVVFVFVLLILVPLAFLAA